jgi:hypothetical protein
LALIAFLAKNIFSGVVLMAKLVNEMFEGINVTVGVVTFRIKNPVKSLASIARRPSRVND